MFLQTCAANNTWLKEKEVSRGFSENKGPKALIDLNLNQFPDAGDATRENLT